MTLIFQRLQTFRQAIYERLGKARDAVFELMDAVLLSPSIPSLVSLSQSPVFRRKWPSIYAALHDIRPPRAKSAIPNSNGNIRYKSLFTLLKRG